jgi:hypothetical protein
VVCVSEVVRILSMELSGQSLVRVNLQGECLVEGQNLDISPISIIVGNPHWVSLTKRSYLGQKWQMAIKLFIRF